MSNMSYCRFENTLSDFNDCAANIRGDGLSEREAQCRQRLVEAAATLLEELGFSVEAPKGHDSFDDMFTEEA